MKTYSFFITIINIVAIITQLVKVFKKYNEEHGIKGLSYWAFSLSSFFVIISTVYLIKFKKRFFYPYYFASIVYFVLITIMILVYEKSNKSTAKEHEKFKQNIIVFITLVCVSILFSVISYYKGSNEYWKIIASISGIGIGLCTIPYVMHVYKHGSSGVSFLFLVLTLMANIVVFISSIITRTWTIIFTMVIYFVTKTMIIAKMIQLSSEDENENKEVERSPKSMTTIVIVFSCITVVLIMGLFLTRIYDKKRNIPLLKA